MGIRITKLSQEEFHFEYDTNDEKQRHYIESLKGKTFKYKDDTYKVKSVAETFDISGYHAFLVLVEN